MLHLTCSSSRGWCTQSASFTLYFTPPPCVAIFSTHHWGIVVFLHAPGGSLFFFLHPSRILHFCTFFRFYTPFGDHFFFSTPPWGITFFFNSPLGYHFFFQHPPGDHRMVFHTPSGICRFLFTLPCRITGWVSTPPCPSLLGFQHHPLAHLRTVRKAFSDQVAVCTTSPDHWPFSTNPSPQQCMVLHTPSEDPCCIDMSFKTRMAFSTRLSNILALSQHNHVRSPVGPKLGYRRQRAGPSWPKLNPRYHKMNPNCPKMPPRRPQDRRKKRLPASLWVPSSHPSDYLPSLRSAVRFMREQLKDGSESRFPHGVIWF